MLDYHREDPTNSNSFSDGGTTCSHASSVKLSLPPQLPNPSEPAAGLGRCQSTPRKPEKLWIPIAFTQEFVESFWQVWPTLKWWVYDGIWVKVAWNLSLEISIVEYLIFIRSTHLIMHMQCAAADLLQVLFRFLHFQAQLLCLRAAENPQRCWGKVRTEDHLDPFGKLLMTVGKQITQ